MSCSLHFSLHFSLHLTMRHCYSEIFGCDINELEKIRELRRKDEGVLSSRWKIIQLKKILDRFYTVMRNQDFYL